MALSLREVTRYSVVTPKGKRIGRVVDAIFHPERSQVVGYLVARPRILFVWDRKDRHLALDSVDFGEKHELVVTAGRNSWDGVAAKRLGIDWDASVLWVGMPVRTEAGKFLGSVRDGLFDPETGELEALGLSGGVTADLAVGVRDLPASSVVGFNGESVVVREEAAEIELDGGAAAEAGRQAAVAKKVAGDAAATAVAYGKSAAKVARNSETGKKAMGWLKALKDEVVDAMGDPDDD